MRLTIRGVVFDLDGVIISSEEVWDDVRQDLVANRGGRWRPEGHDRMMGMSTPEWTAYMHEELDLDMSPADIASSTSVAEGASYTAVTRRRASASSATRTSRSNQRESSTATRFDPAEREGRAAVASLAAGTG